MNAPLLTRISETLKKEEGCKKNNQGKHIAYQDHLGYWTLGYGRLIDPNKPGAGLTEDEAMALLFNNIDESIEECRKNFQWFDDIPEPVQEGLIYMCFQLGMPTLKKFKNCLAAIEEGNYAEAADHCLDSNWNKQTPRRVNIVCNLFTSV